MSERDEEPTGAEQVADSPRERRLELVVTILLAAAALLSAWCAYQSARFSSHGERRTRPKPIRLQVDATAADNAVTPADAHRRDRLLRMGRRHGVAAKQRRANFLRERFRDEMKPAFEAWVASGGWATSMPRRRRSNFPSTAWRRPTRPPRCRSPPRRRRCGASRGANADEYLLAVVLYAAALFQLGIQSRIGVFELRRALVVVAGCIVVGTTVWVVTLPTLYAR